VTCLCISCCLLRVFTLCKCFPHFGRFVLDVLEAGDEMVESLLFLLMMPDPTLKITATLKTCPNLSIKQRTSRLGPEKGPKSMLLHFGAVQYNGTEI
jgi:hypothetical protein